MMETIEKILYGSFLLVMIAWWVWSVYDDYKWRQAMKPVWHHIKKGWARDAKRFEEWQNWKPSVRFRDPGVWLASYQEPQTEIGETMKGITEERLEQKFKEHEDNKTQIAEGYRFAIASCISECQELNPWQPIDIAPKDRLVVLYTNKGPESGRQWIGFADESWCLEPTHWKEVSLPPAE